MQHRGEPALAAPKAKGYIIYTIRPWIASPFTKPIRTGVINPVAYPKGEKVYEINSYRRPGEKVLELNQGLYVMAIKVVFGKMTVKEAHTFEITGEHQRRKTPLGDSPLSFAQLSCLACSKKEATVVVEVADCCN